jgi:D-alanine transaminase/branched-chain amino acid aminotransferase
MPVYFNDRFIEDEEALIHVSDLSVQRGYAIFDFFRTVNGIPIFMNEHLDRFFNSAEGLHLPVNKTKEVLVAILNEMIKRSSLAQAGIRIQLTGGYSSDGYSPSAPNLFITCGPVKTADKEEFEKGISVITYMHQRELPHIKSINYLSAVWLQPLMKEKGVDDVLYYNKESITEFPRSNVFIITKNNVLVTPSEKILKGITRKNVLSIANEIMEVKERNIHIDELMDASEVFLTSTTKKILPVIKINDKIIGDGHPGKNTRMLFEKFTELEKSLLIS